MYSTTIVLSLIMCPWMLHSGGHQIPAELTSQIQIASASRTWEGAKLVQEAFYSGKTEYIEFCASITTAFAAMAQSGRISVRESRSPEQNLSVALALAAVDPSNQDWVHQLVACLPSQDDDRYDQLFGGRAFRRAALCHVLCVAASGGNQEAADALIRFAAFAIQAEEGSQCTCLTEAALLMQRGKPALSEDDARMLAPSMAECIDRVEELYESTKDRPEPSWRIFSTLLKETYDSLEFVE